MGQRLGVDPGGATLGGWTVARAGRALTPQPPDGETFELCLRGSADSSVYLQSVARRRYLLLVQGVLCERAGMRGCMGPWERLELRPVPQKNPGRFHIYSRHGCPLYFDENSSNFATAKPYSGCQAAVFAFQLANVAARTDDASEIASDVAAPVLAHAAAWPLKSVTGAVISVAGTFADLFGCVSAGSTESRCDASTPESALQSFASFAPSVIDGGRAEHLHAASFTPKANSFQEEQSQTSNTQADAAFRQIWAISPDSSGSLQLLEDVFNGQSFVLCCITSPGKGWQRLGVDRGCATLGACTFARAGRALTPQPPGSETFELYLRGSTDSSVYLQSVARRRYLLLVQGVLCERARMRGCMGPWERLELRPVPQMSLASFHIYSRHGCPLYFDEATSSFVTARPHSACQAAVFAFQPADVAARHAARCRNVLVLCDAIQEQQERHDHQSQHQLAARPEQIQEHEGHADLVDDDHVFTEDYFTFLREQRSLVASSAEDHSLLSSALVTSF